MVRPKFERPETIICNGWTGKDGTEHACGKTVTVNRKGAIPKYCPECRRDKAQEPFLDWQKEMNRARSVAADPTDTPPDPVEPDPVHEVFPGSGPAPDRPAPPVVPEEPESPCAGPGCAMPDAPHVGKFCDAHWRQIPLELRGLLLGTEPGTSAWNGTLMRAISRLRSPSRGR